ncbi:ATP-dependent DNA ligase [Acinetobacter brisouii]|uniref:ATP-dependent DNA ligase n=1 Tax=Acinetobacter brisouii TaxID=396323 RepID=UPI00124CCF1D|nr:DNA ligase [Acinetobacter brisouii]
MNSKQVLIALDEIANTSSKKEKETLVKKYAQDELFVRVLKAAYNPFYVYGIIPTKSDDDFADPGELMFDEMDTENFLQQLINRELTGNAARDALQKQLSCLDAQSGKLLIRILRKDLRAGFGESTINKAVQDLIPVFPYMRCSLPKDAKIDEWNWEKGILSQEKADGMFANGTNLPSGFIFSSRQGTPIPMDEFAEIKAFAEQHLESNYQYHGELLVERNGEVLAREIGNGILNSVAKGGSFGEGERPIYVVWDLIPLSEVKAKGKFDVIYAARFKAIHKMLVEATSNNGSIRLIQTRMAKSKEAAYAHFFELTRQGKEGTIIKQPTMTWKDGTSKGQVKLKVEAPCELEVTAINLGKVGSKNEGRAGALRCKSACGELEVDVAVKNESMRDEIDKDHSEWVGKIVTVVFNQILNPSQSNDKHSLFLPRLADDTYRSDKSVADNLGRIKNQFNNIVTGA